MTLDNHYPRLKNIDCPETLRRLPEDQSLPLADELRAFLLDSVSRSGGHQVL